MKYGRRLFLMEFRYTQLSKEGSSSVISQGTRISLPSYMV